MKPYDEAAQARRRQSDLVDATSDRLPVGRAPSRSMILKTVTVTSYPTSAGVTFGAHIQTMTCVETEGATPVFTDTGILVYGVHFGSTAPPVGSTVLATQEQSYLLFDY